MMTVFPKTSTVQCCPHQTQNGSLVVVAPGRTSSQVEGEEDVQTAI